MSTARIPTFLAISPGRCASQLSKIRKIESTENAFRSLCVRNSCRGQEILERERVQEIRRENEGGGGGGASRLGGPGGFI